MARRAASSEARPRSRHSPPVIRLAAVIALACLISYSNGLAGPFIYDDELSIVENRHIRALGNVRDVLSAEQDSPTAGRPLVNLSFAINYATSGLDVRAYHTTNLIIHLLCALAVFGVIRRTLELPQLEGRLAARPEHLACAAALLWAVHPLNSEVVEYVTQRTESMMALFYLTTLYASVRAFGHRGRAGWQAAAVAACALGMACKESMATAPAVVLLYDRVYVFGSFKDAFLKRWRFYLALSSTWLLLAALMSSNPRGESAGFTSGVHPWTYLLNQTVIIAAYLRRVLWPRSLVAGYGWMQPLTLGDVVPYALLLAAVLTLVLVALIRKPKLGFLGAWFFIVLAPTSSVVPIPIEVGAERRMYLPLVALVMLGVLGASNVFDRVERRFAGTRDR
ncbi:MAG: hypothetical protein GEU82_09855, partial [Luteitalea sp.]|nr:hypothetical protein [Luteitalea sp.]